jgi:hypothetical protein
LAIVPVLAEEAVEGARPVKDGQVDVSVLGVPLADPVGYTVGGKGIVVPVEDAFGGSPSQVHQLTLLVLPQAAKASLALRDATIVDTQGAMHAIGVVRRCRGQVELTPCLSLHFLETWQHLCRMLTDAVNTGANGRGDQRRGLMANRTFMLVVAIGKHLPSLSLPVLYSIRRDYTRRRVTTLLCPKRVNLIPNNDNILAKITGGKTL